MANGSRHGEKTLKTNCRSRGNAGLSQQLRLNFFEQSDLDKHFRMSQVTCAILSAELLKIGKFRGKFKKEFGSLICESVL